jgi:ribonuclease HI
MLVVLPKGRAVYAFEPANRTKMDAMLFADGGSRGNPGPAASAAVLLDPGGELIEEIGAYLGVATNNVAEWTALVLDSELVVKQLGGEYRVKHSGLQPLYARARRLLRDFAEVEIRHVPRKQNTLADALVNRVLDQEARPPVT